MKVTPVDKAEINRQKILDFLSKNPGQVFCAKELSQKLGMGISSAGCHCDNLRRQGQIRETTKFKTSVNRSVRAWAA